MTTYVEEQWRDAIMGKNKDNWEAVAHRMKEAAEGVYKECQDRQQYLREEHQEMEVEIARLEGVVKELQSKLETNKGDKQ